MHSWSPDGQWLAGTRRSAGEAATPSLYIYSFESNGYETAGFAPRWDRIVGDRESGGRELPNPQFLSMLLRMPKVELDLLV